MASTVFLEEERIRRMFIVYDLFIKTNMSSRKLAEYISNSNDYNFNISNVTVCQYLKNIQKMLNKDQLKELLVALEDKKEKTIKDNEVKKRVLSAAKYCIEGKKIEEIAVLNNSTYWQTNRDLNYRLKSLDINLYNKVKIILKNNSINNNLKK